MCSHNSNSSIIALPFMYDFNITYGSANDNLTSANLYGGEERHKWT